MSEAVIFIGIPATGKSSFFCQEFARTHVRINLDSLRTRHREKRLFETCLECAISFVVDNTNVTREERKRYIEPALEQGFRVRGFFFQSKIADALQRNTQRADRIPDQGVLAKSKMLELPSLHEGFSELKFVRIEGEHFKVDDYEVR